MIMLESSEGGGEVCCEGGENRFAPPSQLRHCVKCKRIERYIFYIKNRNSVGRAVCVTDYRAECDVI